MDLTFAAGGREVDWSTVVPRSVVDIDGDEAGETLVKDWEGMTVVENRMVSNLAFDTNFSDCKILDRSKGTLLPFERANVFGSWEKGRLRASFGREHRLNSEEGLEVLFEFFNRNAFCVVEKLSGKGRLWVIEKGMVERMLDHWILGELLAGFTVARAFGRTLDELSKEELRTVKEACTVENEAWKGRGRWEFVALGLIIALAGGTKRQLVTNLLKGLEGIEWEGIGIKEVKECVSATLKEASNEGRELGLQALDLMLRRSKRIAAHERQADAAEQQLPLAHPSAMDDQGNPTVDNAASGSPGEACNSNPLVPQVQQVGSTATPAGALDAAPVRQQGETMMAFLARLGTNMQQVREEQQCEAAAETARLNAIARDAEQPRRQHAEAAANHNKARKDAASVLMQQEAAHTAAVQAWNVDPQETTEPTVEEKTKQRRRPSTAKLGKLSSAGSEATPLPTSPDTVALLTTSSTFGEHAYVASLHEGYEDYAVQLVPSLDQPLHVQESYACTTSTPSPSEPASSSTLFGDSSIWSRLEELDPLTLEDFQWLPLPPSGSLPKPHCNALMAELRTYLHATVPAPLMEDGVAVVDLREYIVKIDRDYATQRYDNIDAPLLYVRIQIGKVTCNALIDCGATRNHISQDFMTRVGLGLRVRRKSQPTQVTLVDGRTHNSIDRCVDSVPVDFAPHARETVSFDILDTQFDMILGMSWLRSEDHPVNFYRRTVHLRGSLGRWIITH
ncbi:hypothetical protein CBR_g63074 [Chara braunii]|uniref:Reverse transcriptase domain-containing protein n=1 Tax=Chara braunii TaxID=69332 RepID=A0A388K8U8_CHABU|nr:hypothetical protein CBR_g63074 [Chara braunii]|eukprot:GBG66492.1 hypothetical protein CBR_g63074 [Chara braunii]